MKARIEMRAIVQAVESYYDAYGHLPASGYIQAAAKSRDFTYGAVIKTPVSPAPIGTMSGGQVVMNSEVIAILMDFTNFPGQQHGSTINTNHCLNPQQTRFLSATLVTDPSRPGIGPDLVYRDPWGTPYFITFDLNGDGQCNDAFYGKRLVSQSKSICTGGWQGLTNQVDVGGNGNHFQWPGRVMVWSAGPDRKINPALPADQGENKDNIVSW